MPGGLGGIFPAMANSILALRLLGYPDDHPLVRGQLKEIEALAVEDEDELHYQPCPSPVWDTCAGRQRAGRERAGAGPPRAPRGPAEWLLDRQILVRGDWQVKRPHAPPGGWAFQYANDYYPDLDDTAVMASWPSRRFAGSTPTGPRRPRSGGWAGSSACRARTAAGRRSTPTTTGSTSTTSPSPTTARCSIPPRRTSPGRGSSCWARSATAATSSRPRARIAFDPAHPAPRRPLVRALGRQLHLRHVVGAAGAPGHRRGPEPGIRPARRPLAGAPQNPDGGWGEICDSYGRPELAGIGASTPARRRGRSWPCWPPAGTRGPAVERGIAHLLRTQREDGAWEDARWNGTGFPRVFMLKYHLYAKYFPLWALGVYRRTPA